MLQDEQIRWWLTFYNVTAPPTLGAVPLRAKKICSFAWSRWMLNLDLFCGVLMFMFANLIVCGWNDTLLGLRPIWSFLVDEVVCGRYRYCSYDSSKVTKLRWGQHSTFCTFARRARFHFVCLFVSLIATWHTISDRIFMKVLPSDK